ncbi:MAG TPA: tol-pal system protein YbgF [Desulfuromonadaceae bacterium]
MPFRAREAACILAAFALAGCAADDLMVKRQAEADAKIEHLIQSGKVADRRVNEIAGQIQGQEEKTRDAMAQVRQLQAMVQDMRIAQEELKARVALLTQQAATPKIELVNPEPAAKGKDSGPPPEYVRAFGLYSANSFRPAIEAFEAFLRENPRSDYAANAVYWIGECHYSLSDFAMAQATFQKVLDTYPKSTKFPDALLKLGYSLSALKEKEKAAAVFERLIKSYPGNPAAAKARERLTAN